MRKACEPPADRLDQTAMILATAMLVMAAAVTTAALGMLYLI